MPREIPHPPYAPARQPKGRPEVRSGGYTVAEVVVALAIMALLSAISAPLIVKYVRDARIARAQAEVRMIGDAIKKFEKDLARWPMFTAGAGTLPDSAANVVRLEGPGDLPGESLASAWTAAALTDGDCAAACTGDTLSNQLQSNTPGYPASASPATPFKWNGPYLDKIEADPWGNKYLVNIINAKSASADAVFILSAGPNGRVETPFNVAKTAALQPAGDDILFRIR